MSLVVGSRGYSLRFIKLYFNFQEKCFYSRSTMSLDLSTVGENKVKNVTTGESVPLKTFWQNNNTVIIFFRRWGCMFCRLWAKEISEIAPLLKQHDIKLVGVGVEELGSKDFADGKFFDGDLYYVEDTSTYLGLSFKRFNFFTILGSLLWKQSRDALSKGKAMGVGGDLKGDYNQVGGALFVEKGGKLLRHFAQTGPADHMSNLDILKEFGLENEYKPKTEAGPASETGTEAAP